MSATNINTLQLYSNEEIVKEQSYSGSDSTQFRIIRGSRIVVSMIVKNHSGGPVTASIENSGDRENWLEVLTFSLSSDGIQQKIYSDFHQDFKVNFDVPGTADIKIIVTVHDNSASTFIENANLLVDVSHTSGDSVQVGDGVEIVQVNPDGSINVQLTNGQTSNQIHENYENNIDPGVDGYAFKPIAAYASLNNATQIKHLYVHAEAAAQIRVLIDGTEIRRQDVNSLTGIAEVEFRVPRNLPQAEVLQIEARVAPEIENDTTFRSALEAFLAS